MRNIIAILEDDEQRTVAMMQALENLSPDSRIVFFDNAPDMISWINENIPSVRLFCLDHDLGPDRVRKGKKFDPGVGRDVVDILCTKPASCPILIHSSNPVGAEGMQFALEYAGWSVVRAYPFEDLTWIQAHWIKRVAGLLNLSER